MTASTSPTPTNHTILLKMGIRGLGGFIKWKLPRIRRSLIWSNHAGERWGVDCSCLLYRARGVSLSPLTVIASLIVRMRHTGIEPIFILDGRSPAVKSETVEQRRVARVAVQKEMAEISAGLATDNDISLTERSALEKRHADLQIKAPSVTSGDKDAIKTFLHAAGVLFVTAAGEADDVLAYLCRTGHLQAVISTDMDMLARGIPLLVVPETNDATVLTMIRLADILTGLSLKYTQFVDACMLMGSDYSGRGWRTVEPKVAVEMARRGVDWSTIDVSGSVCSAMERGVALLSGAGVIWEDIVSEKQRAKWLLGRPLREPETVRSLATANGWPMDWCMVLGGA